MIFIMIVVTITGIFMAINYLLIYALGFLNSAVIQYHYKTAPLNAGKNSQKVRLRNVYTIYTTVFLQHLYEHF